MRGQRGRSGGYERNWADADPERICASDGNRSFTYREMDGWAGRLAAVLGGLGVGDGDRFGVLARNCLEWVAIYYAAFKAGAVPVPLNVRLHPREWAYLLGDSGAKAILAQTSYIEALEAIRPELPAGVDAFAIVGDEPADPPAGWLVLSDLVAAAAPPQRGQHQVPTDHDLWHVYTSGTTGRPKGAILTHTAVDANMVQIRTALSVLPNDRILLVLPLFHAGAAATMAMTVASGASMRIVADFDPAESVRILDEERITCAMFVPAMIQAMLVHVPDLRERRYEHLRAVVYGASPIAEDTLRQALDVFGCDFLQVFGQTESSAGLTVLGPGDHRRALSGEDHLLKSCGRPLVGTEVTIIDGNGKPLETGKVGEIVARGPQMMRQYWNMPDATAATLADGWLHTGDAGYLDDEGFLYISDRLKDMIVSGGENIYPREIEDVINQMPGVAEAAVIGVPDDRWGETVMAVVAAEPGESLTEASVIAWCRDHLAGYKAPRSVDFTDALPRNATGKVQKTTLREPYWEGRDRQVG